MPGGVNTALPKNVKIRNAGPWKAPGNKRKALRPIAYLTEMTRYNVHVSRELTVRCLLVWALHYIGGVHPPQGVQEI